MATSLAGVWAAGDCVHTHHRLLPSPTYSPLGTTAHKQGRVAGENAAGGTRRFDGVLGTQVVKVFGLAVAATGLHDATVPDGLYTPFTHQMVVADRNRYYPGAVDLVLRMTGDARTGRILGAQIVGGLDGQVAKRIDIVATAVHHGMTMEGLSDLDLSYTPPFSSPWDPVQARHRRGSGHCLAERRLRTEEALHPSDVVPASVLEADLAIDAHRLEAERAMERDAGVVRQRHPGNGQVESTFSQAGQQGRIQGATPARAPTARLHVDADLTGPAVGRSRPEREAIRVPDDALRVLEHDPRVPP
jgi:hypothetical protein